MNVQEIVEQHLKNMGFDGLYTPGESGYLEEIYNKPWRVDG